MNPRARTNARKKRTQKVPGGVVGAARLVRRGLFFFVFVVEVIGGTQSRESRVIVSVRTGTQTRLPGEPEILVCQLKRRSVTR